MVSIFNTLTGQITNFNLAVTNEKYFLLHILEFEAIK